ncbi:type II and III secretion system protein family protein [Paracoccus salsus]|uniref:type II and III secretion system protein family protein n=1 Tax=Paracoccus salsus TaxID=2911061 RepID=UPI001F2CB333|nr:type II and III secretion system protein family protein [Paracoccus salsus]MCF3972585.1 type II and III secretion system protein family protein [Paracoccus salsus]
MPPLVEAVLARLALVLLLIWPVALPAAAQDSVGLTLSTRRAAQVQVPVGESQVFTTTQDIDQLVIGNPAVADVVVISPRSFYILGQSLGQTNLQIFAGGEALVGLVDLEVTVDTGDLASVIRSVAPGASVRVASVNGRLRLSGTVQDAVTMTRILDVAEQYGSDEVINAIQITDPQQVFLKVRMIEASREAGRAIGLGVSGSGNSGTIRLGTGRIANPVPFGSFLATMVENGVSVSLLIEALEERGLVRNLAEPTLAALSGETASFLAGGEVPIPVAQNDSEVTVQYKEFGVRLTFTPVVLGNGLINLKLEPEVSQLDLNRTYNTGTIELPSFSTRRASTTIELRAGQSFVIAGLLQRNNARRQSQVPWLGSVPILGTLFRSASWQKDETDLVIIVTPYLNRPEGMSATVATPLDSSILTTEQEFFLRGKQEITRGELERRLRQRAIDGPFGHILGSSNG